MRSRQVAVVIALVSSLLVIGSARSELVTYTFEEPQFGVAHTTPLSRAPNIGPSTFQAAFSSAPTADGFLVFVNALNSLMTGQIFQDLVSPADTLSVTLNQPVNSVVLEFALLESGHLDLSSAAGNASQDSSIVGGPFQGGVLSFSSATAFSTFDLKAFSDAGAATFFAIDDLRMNWVAVPEPYSLALFAMAMTLLVARRARFMAQH
jgi:hypothetical protein